MEVYCYSEFKEKILSWWVNNKREFPWRRTKDPYLIMVAEVMLQRTNADKVKDAYNKFIRKYPNIFELNKATLEEIRKIFEPLGLNKRAEVLLNLSSRIIDDYNGEIPPSKEELLDLYGVGNYIAHAVLCFSFGESYGLLDTNTVRIFTRVFGISSELKRPRLDKSFQETANEIVGDKEVVNFNYALLDFGALICRKRSPYCCRCVLSEKCYKYNNISEE